MQLLPLLDNFLNEALFLLFLQALGYYIKYSAEYRRPPLVFVLSEKSAKLILFPFKNKSQEQLIECVLLPDFPLWVNASSLDMRLNYDLLVSILLLCGGDRIHPMTMCVYPEDGTPKRKLRDYIHTVTENVKEEFEKKILEIQKENEKEKLELQEKQEKLERKKLELQEEIQRLRAELVSVLPHFLTMNYLWS